MDFPYIRAWHFTSGAHHPYVEDLLAKARRMKAPADTCFFEYQTGRPITRASILAKDPRNSAIERCDVWLEKRNS